MWVDAWPVENRGPAKNQYDGNGAGLGFGRVTIARHGGASPASAPRNLTASSDMKGATTIVFYDGHASSTKLNKLWTFEWHDGWVLPGTIPAPQ
jgi:hypothetical protein